MAKRKFVDNAGKILKDRYQKYTKQPEHTYFEPCTFVVWCEVETKYDYKFYKWLFADSTIEDYGKNLTSEEKLIAKNFFECLEKGEVFQEK